MLYSGNLKSGGLLKSLHAGLERWLRAYEVGEINDVCFNLQGYGTNWWVIFLHHVYEHSDSICTLGVLHTLYC